MSKIDLRQGDCLEVMKDIPDGSVDMVLADPPYGTTACKWDSIIPLEPMWEHLKRIIKPNGAVVLFGSQPFTSALIMSNPRMFKYEWIWQKSKGSNFMNLKYQPFKKHENILIFSTKTHKYNPIMEKGTAYYRGTDSGRRTGNIWDLEMKRTPINNTGIRYPSSIQFFNNPNNKSVHPTQKPVPLLEYLIKTYTNEGETVLDFTMGSGSTGVACKNLNRDFIGIELDETYFEIAKKRIEEKTNDQLQRKTMEAEL